MASRGTYGTVRTVLNLSCLLLDRSIRREYRAPVVVLVESVRLTTRQRVGVWYNTPTINSSSVAAIA